jgi:tripartite-type tricarboxylate transporter receptor subunit TctC
MFGVSVGGAFAQEDYPIKNIELICPYGAGGSTSMGARIIAGTVSEFLGKPVIVVNKTGAGGSIAAAYAAKAKPDGYTLFVFNSGTNGVTPATRQVTYANADFELFGQYASQMMGLVVRSDAPWKTVGELVEYAKKNPGVVKFGTSGVGTSGHFGMELFKIAAGDLKIDHVPFKSGPEYIAAMLGNHIQLGFWYVVDFKPQVDSGRLRLLATAMEKRYKDFPDVPTFVEAGYPDVKLTAWYGISAPKGVPKQVSEKLKDALYKTFQNTDVKKMLVHIGYDPVFRDAEQFKQFVSEEEKKYQRVAREANIKID